jgi:hypothetical protein
MNERMVVLDNLWLQSNELDRSLSWGISWDSIIRTVKHENLTYGIVIGRDLDNGLFS